MKFSQHVLQETNAYHLHVESEEQLEGLPDSIRAAAKAEAENRKLEGWVFTLHFPSYVHFMKYAANRALREELSIASTTHALKRSDEHTSELQSLMRKSYHAFFLKKKKI